MKFTLNVYSHAMRRDDDERERLRELVNGTDGPAPAQASLRVGQEEEWSSAGGD